MRRVSTSTKVIGLAIVATTCVAARLWYVAKKPKHQQRRIAFDIDETLLYSRSSRRQQIYPRRAPDYRSETREYWCRPFTRWTLRTISRYNQLFLFTAGKKKYAEEVKG